MTEGGYIERLKPRQRKFLELYVAHGSLRRASRESGVPLSTCQRWLRDPQFRSALREAQHVALDEVLARLRALAHAAVDTLEGVMASESSAAARLRAAELVLSNLTRLSELLELEGRVAALEAQLGVTP